MRTALPLFAALALSACADAPEIKACEDFVKSQVVAPSTYKRISADSILLDNKKPISQHVVIEFDAANAFGTPIRKTIFCAYPVTNGKMDLGAKQDWFPFG